MSGTVQAGDSYVAIGDSYTAAPQTGPLDAPDGCGRSQVNYPHLIAERLDLRLVDNSCSGAMTRHLTTPQPVFESTHPAQLTEINDDTDLVTFRLGANDYGLFSRVILCATGRFGSGTTPCTDLDREAGAAGVEARLTDLRSNLVNALRAVRQRAPDATVLVIGYPQVVPREGTCAELPLLAGDYPWARRLNEGLNEGLADAAEEVGAFFIDVFDVSEGHDICGATPWIAGAQPVRNDATPWHPYPEESRAVADLVVAALD